MRQRVEDLGRIAVLIDNVLEDDFFDGFSHRPKDFFEWFNKQSEDEKELIIRHFAYGRETVSHFLYDIREIAYGDDARNEPAEDH
jgi:hypothetical protein